MRQCILFFLWCYPACVGNSHQYEKLVCSENDCMVFVTKYFSWLKLVPKVQLMKNYYYILSIPFQYSSIEKKLYIRFIIN